MYNNESSIRFLVFDRETRSIISPLFSPCLISSFPLSHPPPSTLIRQSRPCCSLFLRLCISTVTRENLERFSSTRVALKRDSSLYSDVMIIRKRERGSVPRNGHRIVAARVCADARAPFSAVYISVYIYMRMTIDCVLPMNLPIVPFTTVSDQ